MEIEVTFEKLPDPQVREDLIPLCQQLLAGGMHKLHVLIKLRNEHGVKRLADAKLTIETAVDRMTK